MTVSVGTLAQQALRLLGVRIVPLDDSPTLTEMVSFADIATAAREELGILNADKTLAAPAVVTADDIGIDALVELGVLNSADTLAPPTIIPQVEIVAQALDELGVLNSDMVPGTDVIAPDLIATTALIELGVIAADETPSTSDQALVLSKVDTVHESLFGRGIAKWAVTAIPNAVAEEYVKLVALESASSFGKTVDPSLIALLEGRIREVAIVMTGDIEFMTGQLLVVHESLVTKGIAQWNKDTIPAAFYSEYVKLMVAASAATFGKQTDPAVIAMLEDRIRTGATVRHNSRTYIASHVLAVHGSLQAQGIALWNSTAIPQSFAEEYVKLTVANAAMDFGKPAADPAYIAMLEERVRKGATALTVDQSFMLDKVASVHAALDAQGIVWWPPGSVPRAFAEEYVKLTASMAASMFGKQVDPAIMALLEARVRKGAMVLSSDDNAQQAVQAVHDDLTMRGIARWTVLDIPDAVGTSYVTLAADALGPLFGVQVDANDARAAMVALYRYVALPTSGETVATAYF